MSRKQQLMALSILLSCVIATGCNNESNSDPAEEEEVRDSIFIPTVTHEALDQSIKMESKTSCTLDSDCVDEAFCFHGTCVSQCSSDSDCNGGTCTKRGRCVKSTTNSRHRALPAESEAIEKDFKEAADAKVVEVVPGIDVLDDIPSTKFVKAGSTTIEINLVTTKDFGTINYVVKSPENNTVSQLMTAKSTTDPTSGITTYTFAITPTKSSLGDKGVPETIVIDSSAGNHEILLVPQPEANGIYEGTISGNRFNGAALPIRMALEVTPKNAASFDEIEAIDLLLPSSKTELFSPEAVTNDNTVWVKVKMEKENKAQNCLSGYPSWIAKFSTNDFEFAGSKIVDKTQKINRSIRIELSSYDAKTRSFAGVIRDIIGGFYRELDSNNNLLWAKPSMDGDLLVKYMGSLDTEKETIKQHDIAEGEDYRDIGAQLAPVCTGDSVAMLMSFSSEDECKTIATANDALSNVNCLLNASKKLLEDPKLSSQIITKLLSTENTQINPVEGFTSVQDFLSECIKPDGICKERPEITCAVNLLTSAYAAANAEAKEDLINVWHQMMRESYLGKQFSAWQNDIIVRKSWLENADSPSFLADTLANLNKDKLENWERDVLDAHTSVLTRQFSQSSLELLTSSGMTEEAIATRDVILAEFAQAWEGVSDAISLALRRYNTLLEKTTDRTAKAKQIRPRLFDLYFSGIIESDINYKTKNTSLNATYGKNLFSNALLLQQLDQSFDNLVYMRDAEVAVSTSLDSSVSNNVLAERKALAKATVASATTHRNKVFDDYNEKQINQASISATLKNTIDALQGEIVNLCGLPHECTAVSAPNCLPRVEGGFCGFDIPADSKEKGDISRDLHNADDLKTYYDTDFIADNDIWNGKDLLSLVNSGEAAEAIMAYRAAREDVDIAHADFTALQQKVDASKEVCESYADKIEELHSNRLKLLEQIQNNIEEMNAHMDNTLEAKQQAIVANIKNQKEIYEEQKDQVSKWKKAKEEYVTEQGERITQIADIAISASTLEGTGEIVKESAVALASFMEDAEGENFAGIASANARGGLISSGTAIWAVMKATSMALEIAENQTQRHYDKAALEIDFKLEEIDRDSNLKIAELQTKLAEELGTLGPACTPPKEGEAATEQNKNCRRIVTCECDNNESYSIKDKEHCNSFSVTCSKEDEEKGCVSVTCELKERGQIMGLDQWALFEENEADSLAQLNDYLRQLNEVNETYERDLQDLAFKRLEYTKMQFDLLTKKQQIQKALIVQYNALLHYYSILQRANMLQSQYDAANERLAEITNLYATPAAVFSFASDLEVVENKIELAKERIYDYLSAIEYHAVRPFVDLRRATYLARSTNDLDAIIDELDSVVSHCGGQETPASVEVSARELMGITRDMGTMTMADRFQYVTRKGNIPVNSLTRYTVDSNVRDLIAKKGSLLRSGTFEVTLDANMNLAATCNAKIESIAIKLVGDDTKLINEGAGSKVIPTMTLFYDGQTQLASCQPNIESIVSNLGPKTKFGKYSTFIVTPTKISPTAGLNKFGEENKSLKGFPLATSYTLLIDPTIGENTKINWNAVEDIELLINYKYQDLFPTDSKCVKY